MDSPCKESDCARARAASGSESGSAAMSLRGEEDLGSRSERLKATLLPLQRCGLLHHRQREWDAGSAPNSNPRR